MSDKPEFNKLDSDRDCTLPPDHPLPPDQLGRYSPARDFYAENDIAEYVLTQARDETVQNVERVKTEYVMGDPYEVWDVHTDKDRWWVIAHDARWLPGWRFHQSDLTGRAVFRKRDAELEVFTANKLPLERLFGVDLIYLNERRGSLVLVQYKMMDVLARAGSEDREWLVAIDKQFEDELDRMERFDRDLSNGRPYRLNSGPFFFKLVKRNAEAKSAGRGSGCLARAACRD